MFLKTVGANTMGETGSTSFHYVLLHRLPVVVLVADLLAVAADGKQALQQLNFPGERTCLNRNAMDNQSERRQDDDSYDGVDACLGDCPWHFPESDVVIEANEGQEDREGDSPPPAVVPRDKCDRNQVRDWELDKGSREIATRSNVESAIQ